MHHKTIQFTDYRLMIPPWQSHSLSNPLEFDRIIEHRPFTKLSDLIPKDLLPRCLTRWVFEWTHFLLSLLDLFWGEFDIGCSFGQVDSDEIAVLEVP